MAVPQDPETGQTTASGGKPAARLGASAVRRPVNAPTPDDLARRRRIGRILLVVVAVALLYGAYRLVHYLAVGRYMEETEDAYIQADSVAVSSKLPGYVRAVRVKDNQLVRRGDVLAEVDPTDYANHVADADAQIAIASANREAAAATVAEARTGIVQADAALAAGRRRLEWLKGQVALYRPLAASGAEPRSVYTQYQSERDQAEQDIVGRQAAVAQAHAKLIAADAQTKQADAQIGAAQVRKRATQSDLGYARIVAPIAGRVASNALRLGQYVQPGQRLAAVVPTNDIYISANFKETQIGLMRPGQPVTVHVDALPGIRFHGYVESMTPGTGANFSLIPPQNATGNFTKIVQRVPVRIYVVAGPQSRRVLVPGLSVRVEVDTRSARNERARIEQEATAGR